MNGKIYKLINSVNDKIYIGSTTQYLSSRLGKHKDSSKDESGRRDSKLYTCMREIGVDKFQIELIEKCTCEILHEREQYWIEQLKPELNMFRAIANPNYYEEHKEEENNRSKKYHEEHREQILERQKKYREEQNKPITCECGCIIKKLNLSEHKKSLKHATLLANK